MSTQQNRRRPVIRRKLYLSGVNSIFHPGSLTYCGLGRNCIWGAFRIHNVQRVSTYIQKIEDNSRHTYTYDYIVNTTISHDCPVDIGIEGVTRPGYDPTVLPIFTTADVKVITTKE